ncbi:hypothetical protein DVR12_10790 [Chitinophaga silvatica]|uniref:Uncharacterized protein n=1 Tax=Chitinophaga silvatica TaxID=2282649 RepID=A0A3E1YBY4_9BACT|nr:hypothetical protein [Chitinophaga silvatica]RFS23491.1 hypothetical protein DVR12_10790 [Chitinophaga silvatica]
MVKKIWVIIFLALVVVSAILYQSIKVKQRAKRNFDHFYNSDLNGKISDITVSVGVVYFKLDKGDEQYGFIPITSELNNNMPFFNTARIGDSIVKPVKSDTLKIIKGNQVYLYSFRKL